MQRERQKLLVKAATFLIYCSDGISTLQSS
jgi:hypothetical protein